MHHLPFAEASLSHKHRKKVGATGQPDESEAPEDSEADSSGSAGEEDQYQQDPPASAHSREEVCLVSSLHCMNLASLGPVCFTTVNISSYQ